MEKAKMAEELKSLQKHMAGLVKTFLGFKSKVEALERKVDENDIERIIEKQKELDKAIAKNNAALLKIEKEMVAFDTKKQAKAQDGNIDCKTNANVTKDHGKVVHTKTKKCRYFNRGYCKYKSGCRYSHPKEVCKEHLASQNCENVNCLDRHPKVCKWMESKNGCNRGTTCDYLHATFVEKNENEIQSYRCMSCKDTWGERSCVVEHFIQGARTYFCLNCEDWVKNKSRVIEEGWSLLDGAGLLKMDL